MLAHSSNLDLLMSQVRLQTVCPPNAPHTGLTDTGRRSHRTGRLSSWLNSQSEASVQRKMKLGSASALGLRATSTPSWLRRLLRSSVRVNRGEGFQDLVRRAAESKGKWE